MADTREQKDLASHVESLERGGAHVIHEQDVAVSGTVKLTKDTIVYIPTPTADPQDPLNMKAWQKVSIIIIISIFSTLGLALVSGLGGLLNFYIPEYSEAGKGYADITHLMTYPTLLMGVGNIFGMPIAIGVGRRIVLLFSTIVMVFGAVLCAYAKSYEWHLAARMVIGLSAGQSESLIPMMTQEIFFLHERSRGITIQLCIQAIFTTVWVLFASPIASAITPQWWYGVGGILSGVLLVFIYFLVPETKYERPASSFQETGKDGPGDENPLPVAEVFTQRPPLDTVNFEPRTWRSDWRLWTGEPSLRVTLNVLKDTFGFLLFPNVLWALCLNGLTLGVNVAIGTTYSNIVSAPPYSWPNKSTSYANIGQIVSALVALPLLGHASDWLIRKFAERRDGLHEPEVRLIPLAFPIIVGVFTSVLYGQGATHPEDYHWFTYVWALSAYYFCFVGANVVGITYLLDSYPGNAGPLLVIICALRGVISFGVSYGIAPFIEQQGYDGAFGTFGGLTGLFGLLAIPIYFWGKRIRQITGRFVKVTKK